MHLFTFPIKVEREGKKYYAYSEDFPGVYGLGRSIDAAKVSIIKAMRLHIQEARAHRRAIPRSRTVYAETISLSL
jgi:predicted RNase H-like HicB family nuclease